MDDSNERYVRKLDQAGVADRGEAKTPTEAEADVDQLPPVSRAAPPSGPPSVLPPWPTRRAAAMRHLQRVPVRPGLLDRGFRVIS